MKILIIENNIMLKKELKNIIRSQPSITLTKISSTPFSDTSLLRDIEKESANFLILNIDLYLSKNIEQVLSQSEFQYISLLITSKSQNNLDSIKVRCNKILIKEYNFENEDYFKKTIFPEIKSIINHKLNTFNKIVKNINLKVKSLEKEKVEKETAFLFENIDKNTSTSVSRNQDLLNDVLKKERAILNKKVIFIGSSIGGITVISEIIASLDKKTIPPILITQHIPDRFAKSFIDRLSELRTDITVQMGSNNKLLLNNNIYISPGDKHMGMMINGHNAVIKIFDDQRLVSKHIPSIDILFRSASNCIGRNALGIILTGMGKDGVIGLGELHSDGATTLAQDKKSCTVQGIAGEAISKGFITKELSIKDIVKEINKF